MKTLNEITVGTKFESVEYIGKQNGIQKTYENVTVVAVFDNSLSVLDENQNHKTFAKTNIINYNVLDRVITVSYKKAEDEKEKTYPNWVVAKETDTHILITKEINGNNLYRNLIKEKIKEIKEMN